jgi:hypothetical protein
MTALPAIENDFAQRVSAVVEKTRALRRGVYYPHLYIVKEDGEPALRLWALSCLIQDRAESLPGYQQFVQQLREKVQSSRLCHGWWADGGAAGERVLKTDRRARKRRAVYVCVCRMNDCMFCTQWRACIPEAWRIVAGSLVLIHCIPQEVCLVSWPAPSA